jgi:hypothetical protein
MTVEQHRVLGFITAYLRPLLEEERAAGRLRPDVDLGLAADYIARMLLSLIGTPGRWDLDDRGEVTHLVRDELLGPVLVPRGAST